MPMAVLAIDYPDRATEPPHSHPRAQLMHSVSGVVTVWTDEGSWVVPPNRGLWIPAGVTHRLAISGLVRTRTLYVEQSAAPHLPATCTVVAISALLRELILAAVEIPLDYAPASRDAKVMDLIVEECRALPVQPLHLPLPADDRISRICDGLMQDPADGRSLKEWAAACRIAERTAARAFLDGTGMTFGRWRQQLRLIKACRVWRAASRCSRWPWIQTTLTNFMKSERTAKWCMYEWFCADMDRPFFEYNDFQHCLNEMGLGHITHLTR